MIPNAIWVEAIRIARIDIKKQITDKGEKVSHFDPKEITKAAEALIIDSSCYLREAAGWIKRREVVVKQKVGNKS